VLDGRARDVASGVRSDNESGKARRRSQYLLDVRDPVAVSQIEVEQNGREGASAQPNKALVQPGGAFDGNRVVIVTGQRRAHGVNHGGIVADQEDRNRGRLHQVLC
jgi:hypothetical protein